MKPPYTPHESAVHLALSGATATRPVTRERLARIAHLSDRNARATIHALRLKGVPVVTPRRGKGYFIATDAATIRQCRKPERARIYTLLREQAKLEKVTVAMLARQICMDFEPKTEG